MKQRIALTLIAAPEQPKEYSDILNQQGEWNTSTHVFHWQHEQQVLEFAPKSICYVRINPEQQVFKIEDEENGLFSFQYDIEDLPSIFTNLKSVYEHLDCPDYLHERFAAPNMETFYERLDVFSDSLPYTGKIYFHDEISEELFEQLQASIAPQANAEHPLMYIETKSDNDNSAQGLLLSNKHIYSSLCKPISYANIESVNKVTDDNLLLLFINEEPVISLKGYWVGDLVSVDFESLISDIQEIAIDATNPSKPDENIVPVKSVKSANKSLKSQTIGLIILIIGLLSLPFKYVEPRQENFIDKIDSYLPFGSILWVIVMLGMVMLSNSLVRHRHR